VHAVLDEATICHVGMVVDGEPVVLPSIHARIGRSLYLHGSTGSRLVRLAVAAEGGLPVCVTVTLLDGLVLARSQMHHSMNYRSVVVRGRAELVTDPAEKGAALAAIVDHVVPGRAAESRPGDKQELAATAVLRVRLREVTLKRRSGPPLDDAQDLALSYWAGVIPLTTTYGAPLPSPDCAKNVPVPGHVRRLGAGSAGPTTSSRRSGAVTPATGRGKPPSARHSSVE
jgi:nitroimidazol reductase NimA-like FMN-containing flavoprotein (pyridoxamine 5'-phosphate oxidase superfamily)